MRFLPLLLAAALLPVLARPQDDSTDNAIHAVTSLREDGGKTVTVTDPEKHSAEASTFDARNRLTQKIVYSLDDQNNYTTGVVYAPNNTPVFKTSYTRDGANRIIQEDDYTMNGQLLRYFKYEFGSDGAVSRVRAFDSQGNELHQSDQTDAVPDVHKNPPRIHH